MIATIRPLVEDDIIDVMNIYNYYVKTSTATFSIEAIDRHEMMGLALTGDKRFVSFVMEEEGKIIGYGLFNRYKKREAYDKTAEVTIYLHHEATGKGYGRQLLAHMLDVAKEMDFHALLAVICEENKKSIQLFEANGFFECAHFREVGVKFGRMLDVIILEKLLNK